MQEIADVLTFAHGPKAERAVAQRAFLRNRVAIWQQIQDKSPRYRYDDIAKSAAWSSAQSRNERAGEPVTSNTAEVTSAGRPTAAA